MFTALSHHQARWLAPDQKEPQQKRQDNARLPDNDDNVGINRVHSFLPLDVSLPDVFNYALGTGAFSLCQAFFEDSSIFIIIP